MLVTYQTVCERQETSNIRIFAPNVGNLSLVSSIVQFAFEGKKKQKYEVRRN